MDIYIKSLSCNDKRAFRARRRGFVVIIVVVVVVSFFIVIIIVFQKIA